MYIRLPPTFTFRPHGSRAHAAADPLPPFPTSTQRDAHVTPPSGRFWSWGQVRSYVCARIVCYASSSVLCRWLLAAHKNARAPSPTKIAAALSFVPRCSSLCKEPDIMFYVPASLFQPIPMPCTKIPRRGGSDAHVTPRPPSTHRSYPTELPSGTTQQITKRCTRATSAAVYDHVTQSAQ